MHRMARLALSGGKDKLICADVLVRTRTGLFLYVQISMKTGKMLFSDLSMIKYVVHVILCSKFNIYRLNLKFSDYKNQNGNLRFHFRPSYWNSHDEIQRLI